MILLTIETNVAFLYFFLGIGALILWFFLLRWAVRASEIKKNQEVIIHIMIEQYKKLGATEEEFKKLKEYILNK